MYPMSSCLDDDAFGPVVHGCRGDFDFTQKFENIVFSLVPSCLFILGAATRTFHLANKPRQVKATSFQLEKISILTIYAALQLSLLILLKTDQNVFLKDLRVAAGALAFLASLMMIILSYFEHERRLRTSVLLCVYLSITTLLDSAQARTLWHSVHSNHQAVTVKLFLAALVIKIVALVSEGYSKKRWIDWDSKQRSPEEISGIYSLSILYWLRNLFMLGFRHILHTNDLYALDVALSAEVNSQKLAKTMNDQETKHQKISLFKALARTFFLQLCIPIFPNVTLIAFQYAQAFFLQDLINLLDNPGYPGSENTGYGLIAACALIYLGVAFSISLSSYYEQRLASMVRACLCAAIYRKTTSVTVAAASDAASVTLMSTDVEHVELGVRIVHAIWTNVINVGIGCWLLYTKLGVAFVAPIVIILLCTIALYAAMTLVGERQIVWMEAIQNRVGFTATAISKMKYFKMLGISEHVSQKIQNLRVDEVVAGNSFRIVLFVAVALSFIPTSIAAPITFALSFRELDTATLFVSVSFLSRVTTPLGSLFQNVPGFLSALASLSRIEAYLTTKPQQDYRQSGVHKIQLGSQSSNAAQIPGYKTDVNELQTLYPVSKTVAHNETTAPPLQPPAFTISKGCFGWTEDRMILQDIDLTIPRGKLTMIVGPVASGKSTLCAALLGEIPIASGTAEAVFSSSRIGYCAQTPFLKDATIKNSIVGFSPYDQNKYNAVIAATGLESDIAQMQLGHETTVGSNGIKLSGGQKQRISLARALYLEPEAYIFDDTLSGLDANTENEVFRGIFGPDGFITQRASTSILCTHSLRKLPTADHIIVLGEDGKIAEQGSYDALRENGKFLSNLNLSASASEEEKVIVNDVGGEGFSEPQSNQFEAAVLVDESRKSGEWSTYMYYLANMSKLSIFGFLGLCIIFATADNFSTIWLSYWSDDAFHQTKNTYLGLYGLISAIGLFALLGSALVALTSLVYTSGINLHRRAIDTVARAPLSLFTNTDTGTLTNLFSQDMNLIDMELPMALINTVFNFATMVGNLFVAGISTPYMVISYPFLLAALVAVQSFYLRTSRQLRLLDLEAKSPLYNHFLDTTTGLPTIRALGLVADEISHSNHLLNTSQRPAYLLAVIQIWLQTVLTLMVGLIATILTILATQLHTSSSFTGASMLTLLGLTSTVTSVVQNYTGLETSIGAITRLRAFSRNATPEDENDNESHVPENWPAQGALSIQNISASYTPGESSRESEGVALDRIFLSIQPGEKVALCGRTGSGKSSLLLLLLRLLDPVPNTGSIVIDDIAIDHINRLVLRQRFIVVTQDPVFLPGSSSIKENIDPFGLATEEECLAVLETARLSSVVTEFGGVQAPMNGDNLSAGQQQLFSLVRAVIQRRGRQKSGPVSGGILILDEMSSKMDHDTEQIAYEIIEREFKGYTIIMVSHRLRIVVDLCSRVVVLDKGVIVEDGDPKVLAATESSWFGKLWNEFQQA